jgi:uncharacterized protein (TIGR02246 family)
MRRQWGRLKQEADDAAGETSRLQPTVSGDAERGARPSRCPHGFPNTTAAPFDLLMRFGCGHTAFSAKAPRAEEGLTMDQDRITELIDKSEITSIVNSYFRALDEKNFDAQHFASIFTPQAKVTRPNGASLIGPEEISASHEKSFTRFEGSQHFVAGHDISLDGSTANVRANLIAMHMWQGSKTDANKLDNVFIAGGVIHATLMQSDGQWRISQLSNAVLWRAGGFRDMMQTGQ